MESYVEHYNDVRLNSAIGYMRRTCSPAVSTRSMPSEIGSWRRHENSVRFVGSRPHEEGPTRQFSVLADSGKRYAVDRERSKYLPHESRKNSNPSDLC